MKGCRYSKSKTHKIDSFFFFEKKHKIDSNTKRAWEEKILTLGHTPFQKMPYFFLPAKDSSPNPTFNLPRGHRSVR